jgi:protein-arginine kinase activator protein McsA
MKKLLLILALVLSANAWAEAAFCRDQIKNLKWQLINS